MKRFLFSFLLLIGATASAAEQPNILWITAEDMSATLGCYCLLYTSDAADE